MIYDFCVLKKRTKSFTLHNVMYGEADILNATTVCSEKDLTTIWSSPIPMMGHYVKTDMYSFEHNKLLITIFGFTKFIPFIPIFTSMLYCIIFIAVKPFHLIYALFKIISKKAKNIRFDGNNI